MSENNRKKIIHLITENWHIKIICLAFAFIVFLFYRRSTLARRSFSAKLNIESTNKLVAASGYPHSVKLTLWGDAVNIASIKEEDLHAYLDLDMYSEAGRYKLPVRVRISGSALNVDPLDISVEPKSIELRLEESATKSVPVYLALKGSSANSFEISETIVTPQNVEIYGPKSLISKIESISTETIPIEDKNTSFSGRAKLVNNNILISISGAALVEYRVKIVEKIVNKDLKNIPVEVKNLRPDLKISSRINPVLLSISGKEAILQAFKPDEDFAFLDFSEIHEAGEYNLEVRLKEINGIEVKSIFPDKLAVSVEKNEDYNPDDTEALSNDFAKEKNKD